MTFSAISAVKIFAVRGFTRNSADVTSFTLLLLFAAHIFAQSDPRIPPEVLHKSGYVNPAPKPADFTSAMLWGIAIADPRVPGFEDGQVEIAGVQLSCRVEGRDRILNDDRGKLRGGLYRRYPWFATDAHEPMPMESSGPPTSCKDAEKRATPGSLILQVGTRPDRVWHFWAASPRTAIPPGHLEGCTVRVRAKISRGALLQIGFDYWRNPTADYGPGGNNHEAGASKWYFPSKKWQEAVFTDIKPR